MEESQRNNFIGHIIKDVFDPVSPAIVYGTSYGLIDTLRGPEFGVETWGLVSSQPPEHNSAFLWESTVNDSHFGRDFANLFVSLDYHYDVQGHFVDATALHIYHLMKDDGMILTVNPGNWAERLAVVLDRRQDIANEIKRYSIFAGQDVRVYQKC